ncbi:MAG TPA: hypothetical protein VJP80_00390 [Candidatus Saccharimonadales bacterium]|nr:hypothetical protein [Candidatus Saccharimonadales bacterium]
MALHLGVYSVTVGIPGIIKLDTLRVSYGYQQIKLPLVTDDAADIFTSNYVELLDTYAALNAQNPWWQKLLTPINTISVLAPGYNLIPCQYAGGIAIDLIAGKHGIDYNWFPSDYANYGNIRTTDGFGQRSFEGFIESLHFFKTFHKANDAPYIEVFLKPGLVGTAQAYQWYGVPPLAYQLQGFAWQYYQAYYPFNQNPFPLPGETETNPPVIVIGSPQYRSGTR